MTDPFLKERQHDLYRQCPHFRDTEIGFKMEALPYNIGQFTFLL